jgi:hypothetical protein
MATTPKSYPQILGGMLARITARLGVRKLKPGSALLTLMEAAAQADTRASQDIYKASQADDLDNATGMELDRIGAKEKTPRRAKRQAVSDVTISDSNITKTFSYVYQGASAPVVGTSTVNVAKGGTFDIAPTTGQIYLGRGTSNYEGPLAFTNKTDVGSYWSVTLAATTTKFHNWGESVILAQGGSRAIASGQLVSMAQGALTSPSTFSVLRSVNIPDGESEVAGVPIIATVAGESSNGVAGCLVAFLGAKPFPTAIVTNPDPITSGRNTETDASYRERIRETRNNKQRGTDEAIKAASIDVSSSEEGATVLSSSLVRYQDSPSVLYIDDGNGYEAKARGIGFEVLIAQANGGENEFATVFSPIAQAFVESEAEAPFSIDDGAALTVVVGGESSTHFFDTNTFGLPTAASAFEVVSSINSNHLLGFAARTTNGGTKVAIYSKSEKNDDVRVVTTGIDANKTLLFPTSQTSTISLYKNDALLQKDGVLSQFISNPFELWGQLSSGDTLTLKVDGTVNVSYTFTNADFYAAGYNALSNATPEIWAQIINSKIPGVTATSSFNRIILTSNKGRSNKASLEIAVDDTITSLGTLVSKGMFNAGLSQGIANDYSIDRAIGSIKLNVPLETNDQLTLGTLWPEGFVQADIGSTPFTTTQDNSFWFVADDLNAEVVPSSEANSIALTSVINNVTPSSNIVRLSGLTPLSANAGDWILFSDPEFASIANGTWHNKPHRIFKDSSLVNAQDVKIERKGCNSVRFAHTATLISNNRVLVCGGLQSPDPGIGFPGALKGRSVSNTAEVFDPAIGVWTQVDNMMGYRAYHTATLLTNGNVFVCGGLNELGVPLATTEIYNPTTQEWTPGPNMPGERAHHTASILPSGFVLIAGGGSSNVIGASAMTSTIEFNGSAFVNATTLAVARYGHQAVTISGGDVIVFGGISTVANPAVPIASVERYSASGHTWSTKAPMTNPRAFFGAGLSGSDIIVAGNTRRLSTTNIPTSSLVTNPDQATYQVYNPGANTWGAVSTFYNSNQYGANGGSIWNQGNLVNSYTSGQLVAGHALSRIATNSEGKNSTYIYYDAGNSRWAFVTTGDSHANDLMYYNIDGREGHVGVAFNTAPLADSVAWFGGINTSSSAVFTGFTSTTNAVDGDRAPIGTVEVLNTATGAFSYPTVTFSGISLTERRLPIVRTENNLEKVTLPTGNDYTNNSFIDAFNATNKAIVADGFQTTSTRLSTKSYDGSLLLVDQDSELPGTTDYKINTPSQPSQTATVVSAGLDVPQDFQIHTVTTNGTSVSIPSAVNAFGYDPSKVSPNGVLKGLKNYPAGDAGRLTTQDCIGNAKGTSATIGSFVNLGDFVDNDLKPSSYGYDLGLREAFDLIPGNPAWIADPFHFNNNDSVAITVDQDTQTKRYAVPMARKVVPATATYQSPLSLRDADNNNATLAAAFDLNYDFNDFAILARARGITHAADATRRVLWRYYRYGAEGNYSSIRYVYPTLPNQPISVRQTSLQTPDASKDNNYLDGKVQNIIEVSLSSGAERQSRYLSNNTRITFIKTSPSTDSTVFDGTLICGYQVTEAVRYGSMGSPAVTRLTIVLPTGMTGSGVNDGDVLWFHANSPSSSTLQSGQFKVSLPGSPYGSGPMYQDFFIPTLTLNDGTAMPITLNPGDISLDSTQKAYFDPSIQGNDVIILTDFSQTLSFGSPMRVGALSVTNQQMSIRLQNYDTALVTQPYMSKNYNDTWFKVFAGSSSTAAQIATAINALPNSPVTAVSVGAGTITLASWDDEDSSKYVTQLKDGINYVNTTNIPGNIATQTTFNLKLPVSSDLTSNNDYANEVFYLSPQLPKSVVQWFNTPAVTGLWSSVDIVTSSNGNKVQIKSKTPGTEGSILVEGGNANLVTATIKGVAQRSNYNTENSYNDVSNDIASLILTTTKGEAAGLCGDTYVLLENQFNTLKVSDSSSHWGLNNTLIAIATNGQVTLNNLVSILFAAPTNGRTSSTRLTFEKVGAYSAINIPRNLNQNEDDIVKVKAGDYIHVKTGGGADSGNMGIFRILKATSNETYFTFWVENPNTIEQLCENQVVFMRADSPVPGDKLVINTNEFGSKNFGEWTITDVSFNTITVDTSSKRLTAWVGNTTSTINKIYITTATPVKGIKKLLNIAPNNGDSSLADLLLSDEVSDLSTPHPQYIVPWGEAAGTILTSLNKLGFTQNLIRGVDAYKYNYGLIAEVKRTIYGDEADRYNYPGYVANGKSIMIQGPTIKRITLALSVRILGNSKDIIGAIKNSVAAAINGSKVGVSIPISDIIAAARVNGVTAVSIIAPSYSSTSDLIVVKGDEKPMVIDLDNDISVVLSG